MCYSRFVILICLLAISASTGDDTGKKESLGIENGGKEPSVDDSSSEAITEENVRVLNENKFDIEGEKTDHKDKKDQIDDDKDIPSVKSSIFEEKGVSDENIEASQGNNKMKLNSQTKQNEKIVTDEVIEQGNSDDDDNVDITEAEIMDILDDVDLYVSGKTNGNGESAMKNVILSDFDTKAMQKMSPNSKISQNSGEYHRVDKYDTSDNTKNENNDDTDILSDLLETFSIDNNSEIKLLDDDEVDENLSSLATGEEHPISDRTISNTEEEIESETVGKGDHMPDISLIGNADISDVNIHNIDDLNQNDDSSETVSQTKTKTNPKQTTNPKVNKQNIGGLTENDASSETDSQIKQITESRETEHSAVNIQNNDDLIETDENSETISQIKPKPKTKWTEHSGVNIQNDDDLTVIDESIETVSQIKPKTKTKGIEHPGVNIQNNDDLTETDENSETVSQIKPKPKTKWTEHPGVNIQNDHLTVIDESIETVSQIKPKTKTKGIEHPGVNIQNDDLTVIDEGIETVSQIKPKTKTKGIEHPGVNIQNNDDLTETDENSETDSQIKPKPKTKWTEHPGVNIQNDDDLTVIDESIETVSQIKPKTKTKGIEHPGVNIQNNDDLTETDESSETDSQIKAKTISEITDKTIVDGLLDEVKQFEQKRNSEIKLTTEPENTNIRDDSKLINGLKSEQKQSEEVNINIDESVKKVKTSDQLVSDGQIIHSEINQPKSEEAETDQKPESDEVVSDDHITHSEINSPKSSEKDYINTDQKSGSDQLVSGDHITHSEINSPKSSEEDYINTDQKSGSGQLESGSHITHSEINQPKSSENKNSNTDRKSGSDQLVSGDHITHSEINSPKSSEEDYINTDQKSGSDQLESGGHITHSEINKPKSEEADSNTGQKSGSDQLVSDGHITHGEISQPKSEEADSNNDQESGSDQVVSDGHLTHSEINQLEEVDDGDKSRLLAQDTNLQLELLKTSSSLYLEDPEELESLSKSDIDRFSETNINIHQPSVETRNNQYEPNVVDMSMKETLKTRRLLAQLDGEPGDESDAEETSNVLRESRALALSESGSNTTETVNEMTTISTSNMSSSDGLTLAPVQSSPCISNPCIQGTCVEDPAGYSCSCVVGYTGFYCETPIDPCLQNPCPNFGTCLYDGVNRVCVCPDGFKGQDCDKVDVNVVCRNLTAKINLHETYQINCTERINSTQDSLCYDPDDSLEYRLTNNTGGALYGYSTGTLECLAADPSFVVKPVYCTTVIATETDDVIHRPWRRNTSHICVTFNEPPRFQPHKPVTINIKNAMIGDIVTTVNVSDSFVFDPIYTIEGVQPVDFQNHFFMLYTGAIEFTTFLNTVPIPSNGQIVSLKIKVDDGGIPPLIANATVNITLVDIEIQCNMSKDIYLGISSYKSVLDDNIVCTGASNLVYSLIDSSGLPMLVGANGTIIVMRSQNIELSPGDYDISVRVSSTNVAQVFVNFTLHVDYFEPSCYQIGQSLGIHKSTPVDTCFSTWYCNETIYGNLECDDVVAGGLQDHLEVFCNVTGSNVVVELCVNSSLQNKEKRVYFGGVKIRNDYGPRIVNTSIEIFNSPAMFLNAGLTKFIYENASIGDVVMTVLVQDDFARPTLEITENNLPFAIIQANGEITVTEILDYERRSNYDLVLRAIDSEGLTTIGLYSIKINDVNEGPTCYHFNGTYIIRKNASTPINTQIGDVNCTDPDNNDRLWYQIDPKSSQEILDLFDINNDTGVITVLSQPQQSVYDFRIVITDKGGLTTDVNVRVFLNFYPPSCSDTKVSTVIVEDISSCIPVATTCTDPQGGSLNFTKAPAASGEPFEVYTGYNNGFSLCPVGSLEGMVGNRQFTIYVINDVGQIPLQMTVTIQDRNSAPYFVSVRNFTVSEKAPQGTIIGQLKAVDNDTDSIFTTLTYTIDEVQGNFTIDGKSGVIKLGPKTLNATQISEFLLQVKVMDGGGLFDTETLRIIVQDINEPPTCQNPLDLVQGTISLTTPVGTLVTSLVCWDHDKEDRFKIIVYNITGDNQGIFSVNGNGEIKVAKPIPRWSTSFRFQVIVADQVMVDSGNLTERTTLDIRVAVDTNFPPVCNKTNSQLVIPETKIVGECIEEILCEDVTLGNITVISVIGTGSDYFEVKSRTVDSQGQLPLNLCVKNNIKNRMGGYTLIATVDNGLGTTSVIWGIEIIDVNEPPYFLNLPYNISVPETQSVGSAVLQVEWLDPDITADFKTITINSIAKEPANATDYITFYPNTNTYVLNQKQNATEQNFFWFEVTATDKGGLSTTTNVTIHIEDVNESPRCPDRIVTVTIELLSPVLFPVHKLDCYDTDRDNNRNLKYVLWSPTPYFRVRQTGKVILYQSLPRFQNKYTFYVNISDGGVPALWTRVDFTVNVNTAVSAQCSQTVDYPSIWVKDSCVKVNMTCTDPTMPDTTHLVYTPSGNYSTAFTLNTESQAVFQLCYNLFTDSSTKFTIIVSNGLLDYRYDLDLEVKYSASTPEFDSSKYTATINEDVSIGSTVVTVNATATGVGSIVYSILGSSQTAILKINASTGVITTNLSLKAYADQTITVQVQALNQVSQLKSSVDVEVSVVDINEAPTCTLGVPVVPVIKVDTPIDTVIQDITCTDPDVTLVNKDLTYTITGLPDAANVFKVVSIQGQVSIATKTLLPVNVTTHNVSVTVRDKGQPPKEVTVPFNVPVNLTPPAPSLEVVPVNMTTVRVRWLYARVDFYTVTNQFILTLNTVILNLPVDKDQFLTYVIDLTPNTIYNVSLTAKTDYGDVVTPVVVVQLPAVPVLSTFICSIRITDEDFDTLLLDPQSFRYVTLTDKVIKSINFVLSRTAGYVVTNVVMYRRGSVIVDQTVTVNQTGTVASVSGALQQAVSSGFLGQMSVDPNYFIVAQGSGYIRITGITAVGDYFEGSTVRFICSADVIGSVSSITTQWRLNNNLIKPTLTSRFKVETLADDPQYPGRKQYQLTVNPLLIGDTGEISCQISDGSLESDWKINVIVIGKPVVTISPLTTIVHQGDSLNIDCKVGNTYPNVLSSIVWYKNGAEFLGGQGEVINRIDIATHHILSITNIQQPVHYECMGMNSAGNGPRAGCTVTVIQGGVSYKYCPTDYDSFGTRWNSTIDGTIVIIPCTGEFQGKVSRSCDGNGNWEDPDYSLCVRVKLTDLLQQSEDLRDGVEVADVDNILQTLTNITSDKRGDLRSGDLDSTSTTLNNVAEHAAERTESISDNQLEEFVASCNNLLSENNKANWEQLKKQNLAGVSKLVEAVTTYSKAFTNVNDQEFSKIVQNENLVVQVAKVKAKDVTFPDRSQTSQPLPAWITESTTQIKLDKANLNGNEPTGFSSVYYKNISDLFGQYLVTNGNLKNINGTIDVNSVIVDFSINPAPTTLNPPLVVEFQHLNVNSSGPYCVFWDFAVPNTPNGAWSTVGARLVRSSTGSTTCEYDHTTNFALLMSPGITPPADLLALSIISAVGCGVSILFLLVTVVLYFALWRYLKSDRATILVNLCVALILSYVLFLAGVTQTENQDICTAIAALLHYIFLVDFHLMLAEGIEIAFGVLYVFSTRSRVHWLVPMSWIVPAVIVAISMGATQLEGYGNSQFCWLSIETGLLWAFVGPALLVVAINLIILILVLKTMFSSHSIMTKTAKEQAKVGLRSVCVILPLFGITWVFGIFSVNEDLVVFQYLFAIFNSLQGVFIFLFHCFFNRQVREGIQHNRKRKMSRHVDMSKSTSQSHTRNSVSKDTDNIHNNLEEELKTTVTDISDAEEESKNPFLQADNQVQQIVSKLLKAGDGKGNNLNKDNPLSIDDIKITNIMREAEINDPPSREADNGTKTSASSIEKKASRSSSDNKSSYSSHDTRKYKASSSSSRARTQSTDLDLRHSGHSEDDFELKMKEDQTRIESVYSASFERKVRSKNRPTHYPQKKTYFEPGPSQKKPASHWGKVKQSVESKKKQKSHDHERSRDYDRSREKSHDKDRKRRGRHRDRSEMYTVDYYDNPNYPPPHHRSMEDMTMHYMGYQQPFIRPYEPLRTPRSYPHPHQDVPWYEVRPDYC